MKFVRPTFRVIVGFIFGLLCFAVLLPALAAFHSDDSNGPLIGFAIVVGCLTLAGFFAPTIRRAFGRGFLLLGASLVFLPISTIMLSGRAAHEVVSSATEADQAMSAVGAGMAGVALTGAATFFGLILGGISIVIGLVLALGGRREVVIIDRA